MRVALAALLLVVSAPALLQAQNNQVDSKAFTFKDKLKAGSWIRIQNLSGDVDVVGSSGDAVEVTAEKRWRRGDPRDVRFEVYRDGDNVTICALWDNDREESDCDRDSYRHHGNNHDNDVDVRFTVKLPAGIRVAAATVNGNIDIAGASTQVRAMGVNGEVRVETSNGPVSASSVNGSVRVGMETLSGTEERAFSSVNGDVELRVPTVFDADLSMSTVNGALKSDFPIMLEGRIDPQRMRGTIGKGGRRLKVSTVNGNLEIRKR
jgi:hypothetical protein